jgi:hypothetical protein
MPKTTWYELIAQCPWPHLVVASLPDETLFSAREAQQLLMRLLKKLQPRGEYAVTISRRSGQQEIVCGFGDILDATLAARTTGASTAGQPQGTRMRHSFVLDESAARKLLTIAGPLEPHRPRATSYDRWQS